VDEASEDDIFTLLHHNNQLNKMKFSNRVARLAFLMTNSRYLAYLSGLAWENAVWNVGKFLACSVGVGRKKRFLAFFQTLVSFQLTFWKYFQLVW